MLHRLAWSAAILLVGLGSSDRPGFAQSPSINIPTYFEFGTVVAIGQHSLDVQTFDERRQRLVQHSFQLSREARADVVRVGDNVEVIFTPGADWTIRRLILLTAGIPKSGPPEEGAREVPTPAATRMQPAGPATRIPPAAAASVPAASRTSAGGNPVRNVAVPTPAVPAGRNPSAASVDLGSTAKPRTTSVVDASLAAGAASLPKTPVTRPVAFEVPREECNRGSADWPSQPLRLAVLDFRYPTEREESHDTGTTGGGSGTAVADLVYSSLDQLNEYAMSRGDRTRLYRGDFAGAARVGRELGVDAVLAGTFQPQDPPPGSDPDFPPPKTYELRAGIVDTCTGQLLLRLTSVLCPPGLDPNAAANANSCQRLAVTAKQAGDPKDQARAFAAPISAMLFPLEHNGPPAGAVGTAGSVAAVDGAGVTLKVPRDVQLKPGDQVAIHAWRLSKNPTTYTLHNLHDEEIGRLVVLRAQGTSVSGTFTGDFPPRVGDTAELLTP